MRSNYSTGSLFAIMLLTACSGNEDKENSYNNYDGCALFVIYLIVALALLIVVPMVASCCNRGCFGIFRGRDRSPANPDVLPMRGLDAALVEVHA